MKVLVAWHAGASPVVSVQALGGRGESPLFRPVFFNLRPASAFFPLYKLSAPTPAGRGTLGVFDGIMGPPFFFCFCVPSEPLIL